MKYLLLAHLAKGCESYYSSNPDTLKSYAELNNFQCYEIYELAKTIYTFKDVKEEK